jgi:hypothetical protein
MMRIREHARWDGVHLRLFRSYDLAEGATAHEPVVVIGGSARIDGHAEKDVVVIGGRLHLGPSAVVDGDVVTVGGNIDRAAGANVKGTVDHVAIPWPSVGLGVDWPGSAWWQTVAFWLSIVRLALTLAASLLLTLVAPRWVDSVARRPMGSSGAAGLATEILFIPALIVLVVALVISIIGIPLLLGIPVLLAALALLWVAGFAGVSVHLGRLLQGARGDQVARVTDCLLGYAAIVAVTVAAQVATVGFGWSHPALGVLASVGLGIEFIAWTVGLGAAMTSLFARPQVMPPPLPV